MGLAYTIDSPVKVARFGISSVISIIQDNLIEKMRGYYYNLLGELYVPIATSEPDYRARRITDYLNLVNRMVQDQMRHLRKSSFDACSDLRKFFEMLPGDHPARSLFTEMLATTLTAKKQNLQEQLRNFLQPGSIDVNIMTKVDKENIDESGQPIIDGSDAVAAMRGFVNSDLTDSSVVLSAGMNPRLFAYMERLTAFDPDDSGRFRKKIVIKVSDYRSALLQGKLLAKKGLWVSEFRIESGLNCGGHAFATDGFLLGPILEEFKLRKSELIDALTGLYNQALTAKGMKVFARPHPLKVTVQGGIGTSEEDRFLRRYYDVDGTGWGTPFLLVPEATTVDKETLELLGKAREEDLEMSHRSPLGVRFHYLNGTSSDKERQARIRAGRPGSPCTEKFLVSDTEFGPRPLCTASRAYQKKKLEQVSRLALGDDERRKREVGITGKECLCIGLSNAAVAAYGVAPFRKLKGVTVCPGPNIAYFSQVVTLQKMTDHIYGRDNIIEREDRPHMFIKELNLYIDYLSNLVREAGAHLDARRKAYLQNFNNNLSRGIFYYRDLAIRTGAEFSQYREVFTDGLQEAEQRLCALWRDYTSGIFASMT
jgi:hypothetical protein